MKKNRSLAPVATATLSVATAGDDATTPTAVTTTPDTISNVLKTRHDTVKNSIGN